MGGLFIILIIAVIAAGIAYWLLSFLPLPAPFDRLVRGLVIVGLVLYILATLYGARGLFHL